MAEYEIGIDTFKQCSGKSNFRDGQKPKPPQDELDGIKARIIGSSKIGALTSGDAAAYLTMVDKARSTENSSPNLRPPLSREQASSATIVSSSTTRSTISSSCHHTDHGRSYPSSKRRKMPGGNQWEASVCSNPPMFMSRYVHGGVAPPVLKFPALSEAEKQSPLGANLSYVMAMFFSLNERILEQRRRKPSGGAPLATTSTIDIKNQKLPPPALPSALSPRHHEEEYEYQRETKGSSSSSRTVTAGNPAQLQSKGNHHQCIFRRQDHRRYHQLQEEDNNANLYSLPKAPFTNLTTNREHHPLQTQERLAPNSNTLLPALPCHANDALSSHEHHPFLSSEHQHSDIRQEYIDQGKLTPMKTNCKMAPVKNDSSSGSHHDSYYHTNIATKTPATTTKATTFEEIELQIPPLPSNTSASCDDLEQLEPYYIYQPAAFHSVERSRSLSLSLSVSLHSLDVRLLPLDDNISSSSGSSIGSELREVIESNSLYKSRKQQGNNAV